MRYFRTKLLVTSFDPVTVEVVIRKFESENIFFNSLTNKTATFTSPTETA